MIKTLINENFGPPCLTNKSQNEKFVVSNMALLNLGIFPQISEKFGMKVSKMIENKGSMDGQ